MKNLLLAIYNKLYYVPRHIETLFFSIINFFVKLIRKPPAVMGIDETMDCIIDNKISIARFGDGEIKLVNKTDISFQKSSSELAERLREVLAADKEGFLPCILSYFDYDSEITQDTNNHWKKHMNRYRYVWYKYTNPKLQYGNSFISRFYLEIADKSTAAKRFEKLKQIWDNRDIIIIEGEKSRLGVGNDLFDNVKSIKRILCPVDNAYEKYKEILEASIKNSFDNVLFILAVGPTATVLAYDLFKAGFQALDIGHADIEYEWFKAGATKKQPVTNKYVNEAGGGNGVAESADKKYLSEIIGIIK
ncbi:MAG: SP_1767 family glycosyltransferase [Clostridia bacterium]|nr:SP_1767 family glycosyltransferase [Clostridia bacterium]